MLCDSKFCEIALIAEKDKGEIQMFAYLFRAKNTCENAFSHYSLTISIVVFGSLLQCYKKTKRSKHREVK